MLAKITALRELCTEVVTKVPDLKVKIETVYGEEMAKQKEEKKKKAEQDENAKMEAARVEHEAKQAALERAQEAQAALEHEHQEIHTQAERIREERRKEEERRNQISVDVAGMQSALDRVAQEASASELRAAIETLQVLISNICTAPENPVFRTIKRNNGPYHEALGRFPSGAECLYAMGFRLHEDEQDSEVAWYSLEEPNLEEDLDKWDAWFSNLKTIREFLLTKA